jgi:hypothetical protein
MAHFSQPVFILASILTRGLRFFMVAGLLRWYGAPIRDLIEAPGAGHHWLRGAGRAGLPLDPLS